MAESQVSGSNRRPSLSSEARARRVGEDSDDQSDLRTQVEAVRSSASRKARGRVVEESDASSDASAAIKSSSRSKKRTLDIRRQSGRTANGDQDENEDRQDPNDTLEQAVDVGKPEQKPVIKAQKARLTRDPKDGQAKLYVMGSVVRIKCHNFLTYYDIECMPGPHLNMIYGPNGAGKSSIAAAIAIGLGFPAKVMGRSKDLKQFVREGCTEGYVEIELKGRPRKDGTIKNLIVVRHMQAKNNASSFQLQGQTVTQAAVTEAVRDLNVNVDNLCSFLPQDRVAAFSALSGPDLLTETQRVSDAKLVDLQEQLAEQKIALDASQNDLVKSAAQLGDKEKKLNSMEKDVRRHNEKERIENEIAIMQFGHPYALYVEEKAKYDTSKRARNDAKERQDALNDNNRPLVEQRDILNDYVALCETRGKKIRGKRDEVMRHQTSTSRKIGDNEQEVEKLRTAINELKAAEQSRKKEMVELEKAIQTDQKRLTEDPPEADNPDLQRRYMECQRKLREIKEKIDDIRVKHNEVIPQIDRVMAEKRRIRDALGNLYNVQRRREAACAKTDAKLWTATTWLREHQREFKAIVYDPIRLLVSAKEPKYAKLAEAAINYTTMKTIVCLEHADYERLGTQYTNFPSGIGRSQNERLRDGDADLRMNIAELPPDKRSLQAYKKPCSQEELSQRWGFDVFAIDLIDGPEHILAYLCESQKLHQVPIAFDDGRRIPHDALRRPGAPFKKYITSQHTTILTFSNYGNREAVAQDLHTKEANIFAETIDQSYKQELELKAVELDAQREQLQTQRDLGIEQENTIRQTHEPLMAERTAIVEERKKLVDLRKAWERTKVALSTNQQRLGHLQKLPSEDFRRQKLVQQLTKHTCDRLKLARKLLDTTDQLLKLQTVETATGLAHLQGSADALKAKVAVTEANEEMTAAVAEHEDLAERTRVLFVSAKAISVSANAGKDRLKPELYETAMERVQNNTRTAEQIAQDIADAQGQLELIANVNPAVVQRYKDLQGEVTNLKRELEHRHEAVRRSQEQIDRLHTKWYPEVQRIVETVGTNFSKAMNDMGCLGEVVMAKDDNYAKWAVKIRVAFRDTESLEDLESHRQSGGEKSLVTMLYLISLLELSKVPFSLVDEINQGMDQRAERAVHNQLVQAVCEKDDVGQYFLITPKLVTNLRYHEKMKVLCINNGEWLPEKLPLGKIIARKLASKTANR
ncbi:MAG: Structural maintenance of chromosomes protein 5 [Cyphobasidiales sp. Tagirdzhanova-0007]|nr:MAG: Structural maintenance of chromosomes protein 5 [Cyphobasidiales sp. Tagirdzhanova-0007]